MVSWHKETVKEIVGKLKKHGYPVKAPYNLPEQTRKGALYQPDIVVFDKGGNNEVVFIIEVQTKNVRKSICGAVILAEICVRMLKQKQKPEMFFVLKETTNEEEIRKLNQRIREIMNSLKQSHIKIPMFLKKNDLIDKY